MKKALLLLALAISIPIVAFIIAKQSLTYQYNETPLPATFEEYYKAQLEQGDKIGVRSGNEVRLIRYAEKSRLALLYIHGFTASRGEGEYVIDRLADSLVANTYYMRLPGHGTNLKDHASVNFKDYVDEVERAVRMMQLLGERVIVVGTSMGGLLATYLAAKHPDMVDGLILCSPFYEFANPAGKAIRIPGVLKLIELIDGPIRKPGANPEWRKQKLPGYENYWYQEQKYSSLRSLDNLRAFVSRKKTFSKVEDPVLMLYYYVNEEHQDKAASVAAMLEAFDCFSSEHKRKVTIEHGGHVMTSEYVKTDKEAVLNAMLGFIRVQYEEEQ